MSFRGEKIEWRLTYLSPEGIQTNFGQSPEPGVLLYFIGIQHNSLAVVALLNEFLSIRIRLNPVGVAEACILSFSQQLCRE